MIKPLLTGQKSAYPNSKKRKLRVELVTVYVDESVVVADRLLFSAFVSQYLGTL